MGGLMNLQFLLEMDEPKEEKKNPFGSGEYELMDLGRSYDRQANKIYG